MKHVPTEAYRRAFVAYLRTGAPIRLALKQAGPTTHYVWRTVGDERVRLSHAQNAGRLFAWNEPPATGHPGEAFGCRCVAVPYVPGETEFAYHEIVGELPDAPERWGWDEFLRHLYAGGHPVTVSDLGYLNDIVEFFGYRHTNDQGVGAFRRLSDQIVAEAREKRNGIFRVTFNRSYDFKPVALPFGSSTVFGAFVGRVDSSKGYLEIVGGIDFYFHDLFTDPANARDLVFETSDPTNLPPFITRPTDLFGRYYVIKGYWQTRFRAEATIDARGSVYVIRE
jgi:hypothetical protein